MSKTLKDIFIRQITGEWGEKSDETLGTPVIRTTNFTNDGNLDLRTVAYRLIPQKKVADKRLIEGDIILEKSGGTNTTPVGRVVYCNSQINGNTYICNNFTQVMRSDTTIAFPKYVFYLMFQLHKSGITDSMQNKTTGIRNLRIKDYLALEVGLPTLDLQQKIATILDKVNALINERKQQLEKIDLLVKS